MKNRKRISLNKLADLFNVSVEEMRDRVIEEKYKGIEIFGSPTYITEKPVINIPTYHINKYDKNGEKIRVENDYYIHVYVVYYSLVDKFTNTKKGGYTVEKNLCLKSDIRTAIYYEGNYENRFKLVARYKQQALIPKSEIGMYLNILPYVARPSNAFNFFGVDKLSIRNRIFLLGEKFELYYLPVKQESFLASVKTAIDEIKNIQLKKQQMEAIRKSENRITRYVNSNDMYNPYISYGLTAKGRYVHNTKVKPENEEKFRLNRNLHMPGEFQRKNKLRLDGARERNEVDISFRQYVIMNDLSFREIVEILTGKKPNKFSNQVLSQRKARRIAKEILT